MEVRILHIIGTAPDGSPVEALILNRDEAADKREGTEPQDYVDMHTNIDEIQEVTLTGEWFSCPSNTTFLKES